MLRTNADRVAMTCPRAFDGMRATPTRPLFTKVCPWKETDCALAAQALPKRSAAGSRPAATLRQRALRDRFERVIFFSKE